MYDYTNTLLYSAKSRNKIKNGKLKYFICRDFDGKNLFIEKIKSPPADMAIANSGIERFRWNVLNLDILASLSPEAGTSMQRDIAKGGSSEIEGLVYAVDELAEAYQVDMPVYQLRHLSEQFGFRQMSERLQFLVDAF